MVHPWSRPSIRHCFVVGHCVLKGVSQRGTILFETTNFLTFALFLALLTMKELEERVVTG